MIKIEELEKDLKNNQLLNLYVFYGEETYLLESSLKKIKKLFGEIIQGINYITIDEDNIEEIIPNLETPAFGYERKLVIVKNTGILKKEGKRKNAKVSEIKERLLNYLKENLENIKNSVILIFVEESADKTPLLTFLEKNGIVCNFEFEKPAQIQKRIKGICNGYKVNIEPYTIQYLIESCGTSMQVLINEIRKLIEYVGENGTIQKEDIDKLAIKQMESIIFDLTDNLGKRNTKKAMEVLQNLIYQKEPIQKILITLYNHFKKIYFVKLAQKYNRDIGEVLNLKPNQTFLIGKYRTQANYFKEEELRKIIQELIDLDYNYKSGIIDINIGLESILCRYC